MLGAERLLNFAKEAETDLLKLKLNKQCKTNKQTNNSNNKNTTLYLKAKKSKTVAKS